MGLGGYAHSSDALEQVGVDADCSRYGHPHYDSWYELIPAAPVGIHISVHAGDEMTGSVTVRGTHVTLRLRNLTTGARYSTTRHTSQIDVSSADWIIEAPSSCTRSRVPDAAARGLRRRLVLGGHGHERLAHGPGGGPALVRRADRTAPGRPPRHAPALPTDTYCRPMR